MKPWLPILIDNLDDSPILALSAVHNLARAAVYDRRGRLLAGALGSPSLAARAAEAAGSLLPGQCFLESSPAALLSLECLAPEPEVRRFWATARQNQEGAWAAWLLTMPRTENGQLKLARHFLSAFGPWTTPRLPEDKLDQWALAPLKAGLGRLLIFGDDALALETAALAARTGLTVTWLTTADPAGPELDEAQRVGDFELLLIPDWAGLTSARLEDLGLQDGVHLLVTTPDQPFLPELQKAGPASLIISGEAETAPGLIFPRPLTTTQKALGLIAEILR
ncbi:MAG: hypothetical protein LBP55_01805 [Candidatus Adiutrix sp.]|jgi:hypothetical protein|nr:hypothetical protein [Candidatus Adiutrix sp.]